MPKSDIGAVAIAWKTTVDAVMKIIGGAKGRRTTASLKSGRKGLNRAKLLYPKLKNDKAFMKYDTAFRKNLI